MTKRLCLLPKKPIDNPLVSMYNVRVCLPGEGTLVKRGSELIL